MHTPWIVADIQWSMHTSLHQMTDIPTNLQNQFLYFHCLTPMI